MWHLRLGWWDLAMTKTTHSPKTTKPARLAAIGAAGLLLASTLSGCALIEGTIAPKAWAITYQVEVTGEGADRLTDVSYGDTDGPVAFDGDTIETSLGDVTTTETTGGSARTWDVQAIIAPEQPAWVEATPGPGASAKCVILIDGKREIQAVQGGQGETVTCKVDTPEFGKVSAAPDQMV